MTQAEEETDKEWKISLSRSKQKNKNIEFQLPTEVCKQVFSSWQTKQLKTPSLRQSVQRME